MSNSRVSMSIGFNQSMILRGIICCSLLLTIVGCGGGRDLADVSGIVTHDGKPLEGMIVNFVPEKGGRTSGGSTNSDGKFQLIYDPQHAGAIVGMHQVCISVEGKLGKTILGSPTSAILCKDVEVVSGNNEIDLKLEDFKRRPN